MPTALLPPTMRERGQIGATNCWGPPLRHRLNDLPAPERAAIAGLLTRVRIERIKQHLGPTVSDRAACAAIAAVLTEEEPAAPEQPAGSTIGGTEDATDQTPA